MAYWLDDGFDTWGEVFTAGTEAAGLYVRCGAWIARNTTDGFVPAGVASAYGSQEWADRLVSTGLWTTVDGGYRDTRYLDLNPTARDVQDRIKAKQEAGRKGGLASGKTRARKQNASNCFDGASRLVEPPTLPLPSSKEGRGARRASPVGSRTPLHAVPDPIEWCGRCNKNTRMAVDDSDRSHPCPDCNPTARAS
jgi:hypothetical protein